MSQHVFRIDDKTECIVGYDSMLGTFFGQVYRVNEDGERIDLDDDDYGVILWVGVSPAEIRTVDDLTRKMKPYVLPEDIHRELFAIECD